jgi:putative endonuclease
MTAFLYILRCADGSSYIGTTRRSLEHRLALHQAGGFDGHTARRRPVSLVFHQEFQRIGDAIAAERQVKGRRREQKEALMRGDLPALPRWSRRAARPRCLLRDAPPHREEPPRGGVSKGAALLSMRTALDGIKKSSHRHATRSSRSSNGRERAADP